MRPARPVVTVLVVRDGPQGPEVLVRQRAESSAERSRLVLPGGAPEEEDADACDWFGPSPKQWARRLDVSHVRVARQYVMAAVRTLFEETGLLLAGTGEDDVVPDPHTPLWSAGRSSLETGAEGLPSQLARRGLGVRTDLLHPVTRWVSPAEDDRRVDAWIFAVSVPPGQQPVGRDGAACRDAENCPGALQWMPAVTLDEDAGLQCSSMVRAAVDCVVRSSCAAGFLLGLSARADS